MSTIAQIQQEGQGLTLGPVKITRIFPKSGFGDKANLFILVEDATGKTGVKIWGPAANNVFSEGEIITLTGGGPKGGLKNQEYPVGSGKWSLNANDCRISRSGQAIESPQEPSQPAQAYQQHQPTQSAPQAYSGDKLDAVAKRAALGTHLYVDALVVNHGFSRAEAIQLAVGAHSLHPLFWFGEKGI